MLAVNIQSMRYPSSDDGNDLIQNLHLSVSDGGFVSLLGRSGAGKTTLLRIIAGLERRFTGQIMIDGAPILGPCTSVQLFFQDSRLLPWKTVFENVAFATMDPTGRTTSSQVLTWLDRVGLSARHHDWPKNLSGGEASRVAIARSLVVQPRALLLDEPFGHLDLMTRSEIQDELIRDLAVTQPLVLMVSHSIDDAVFLSDEVHILSTRPMCVLRSFKVPVPRPRFRGQPELSRITQQITHYLQNNERDPACVSPTSANLHQGTIRHK